MPLYNDPLGRVPQVHPSVYIAPSAVVLGDVVLEAEATVWFQAVIRGDTEAIRIGPRTNVQDGCVLHADPGFVCSLGTGVTLGHGAIVHGATIEDNCLIGMRAVVMNGACIGRGSLVGVGAVVAEGVEIPPSSLVLGLPGKAVRTLSAEQQERIRAAAEHYVERGRQYRNCGWLT